MVSHYFRGKSYPLLALDIKRAVAYNIYRSRDYKPNKNNNMHIAKRIGIVTLIIAGMAGILTWSADHDKKVMEAADRYEDCIEFEYGVSPANWYAEHGEYPTCNIKNN